MSKEDEANKILDNFKNNLEVHHQVMLDELLYGVGMYHIDKEVALRRVDPLSNEGKEILFNCKIEELTVEEIIEKYGEHMTEEEIKHLRK